jgi:hypothetical protein
MNNYMDPSEVLTSELKTIYENDNAGGDCDCSYCREYRERMAEVAERGKP